MMLINFEIAVRGGRPQVDSGEPMGDYPHDLRAQSVRLYALALQIHAVAPARANLLIEEAKNYRTGQRRLRRSEGRRYPKNRRPNTKNKCDPKNE